MTKITAAAIQSPYQFSPSMALVIMSSPDTMRSTKFTEYKRQDPDDGS
jgi:hypothetical protein